MKMKYDLCKYDFNLVDLQGKVFTPEVVKELKLAGKEQSIAYSKCMYNRHYKSACV